MRTCRRLTEDVVWILRSCRWRRTARRTRGCPSGLAGSVRSCRQMTTPMPPQRTSQEATWCAAPDRMITVTGGKPTTFRRDGRRHGRSDHRGPCRTRDIALIGAGPGEARPDVPPRVALLRQRGPRRLGTWANPGRSWAATDPPQGFLLRGGRPSSGLAAEAALTVEDLVDRRTGWGLAWRASERAGHPGAHPAGRDRARRRNWLSRSVVTGRGQITLATLTPSGPCSGRNMAQRAVSARWTRSARVSPAVHDARPIPDCAFRVA